MDLNKDWLLNETRPLTEANLEFMDRQLADAGVESRGIEGIPRLAVCIHDIIIYDNRKWFGEADIRIDALVVTGAGQQDDPESFYMPKTATFSRVKDGDNLPIDVGGLLVFHGYPRHFLDMLIMVSRDRTDTDSLAVILNNSLKSDDAKSAVDSLLGLAITAPEIAAVTAAMRGAAFIGDFAYRLLRTMTGSTIGLYRTSHLQYRDNFGIGPHPAPPQKAYRVNDLSFRYEILKEEG